MTGTLITKKTLRKQISCHEMSRNIIKSLDEGENTYVKKIYIILSKRVPLHCFHTTVKQCVAL